MADLTKYLDNLAFPTCEDQLVDGNFPHHGDDCDGWSITVDHPLYHLLEKGYTIDKFEVVSCKFYGHSNIRGVCEMNVIVTIGPDRYGTVVAAKPDEIVVLMNDSTFGMIKQLVMEAIY